MWSALPEIQQSPQGLQTSIGTVSLDMLILTFKMYIKGLCATIKGLCATKCQFSCHIPLCERKTTTFVLLPLPKWLNEIK